MPRGPGPVTVTLNNVDSFTCDELVHKVRDLLCRQAFRDHPRKPKDCSQYGGGVITNERACPCGCGRLPPLSCLSRSLATAFRASALSRSLSRLGSGEGVDPLRLTGGLCFPLSLLLLILLSSCRSFSGSDPGHHTSIP